MRSEHLALLAQHSRSGNITDYYNIERPHQGYRVRDRTPPALV
jgi:hypothetical protein